MIRRILLLIIIKAFFPLCVSFATPRITFQTTTKSAKMTKSPLDSSVTEQDIVERAEAMNDRASRGVPLTDCELETILRSFENINESLDKTALHLLLQNVAHLSHKDWKRTANNAKALSKILLPQGLNDVCSKRMLHRILTEGNWDGALSHAERKVTDDVPWAVLVTGVNGIRKTTSLYQSWFPALLEEALVAPSDAKRLFDQRVLPTGERAFFRQLDHMIATVCNEEFSKLYQLTQQEMEKNNDISTEIVQKYSNLKAAIFARYRTLSELLGVMLLEEAKKESISCMMETSGRDVAMFRYVDEFFPSEQYHKLALHFVITDLACAQQSVDARMMQEIKTGLQAIGTVSKVIDANAGGPYGSEVLPSVQEASDKVWKEEVLTGNVGSDWYKATIQINPSPTEPWTAQAVKPDGSLGTRFTFQKS